MSRYNSYTAQFNARQDAARKQAAWNSTMKGTTTQGLIDARKELDAQPAEVVPPGPCGKSEPVAIPNARMSMLSENLAWALKLASLSTAKRPSLTVLGHVLIASVDGSRLAISGTNLEVGITAKIGGKVEVEGAVTVDPVKLSGFLAKEDSRVDLTWDDENILTATLPGDITGVKEKRSSHKGIQASEFPLAPSVSDDKLIGLVGSAKQLKAAIKCALEPLAEVRSKWEQRDNVQLRITEDHLILIGGTTAKMHRATLPALDCKPVAVLLSDDVLKLLSRALPNDDTDVKVYRVHDNQIGLSWEVDKRGSVEFVAIIAKESDQVIALPEKYPFSFGIDATWLATALKRADVFNKAGNCTIEIERTYAFRPASQDPETRFFRSNRIAILAESEALGNVESHTFIHEDLWLPERELSFNIAALRDVLDNVKALVKHGLVTIRFAGPSEPILIEAQQGDLSLAAAIRPEREPDSYVEGRNWECDYKWATEQAAQQKEHSAAYDEYQTFCKVNGVSLESRARISVIWGVNTYRGTYSQYDVVDVYEYLLNKGPIPGFGKTTSRKRSR